MTPSLTLKRLVLLLPKILSLKPSMFLPLKRSTKPVSSPARAADIRQTEATKAAGNNTRTVRNMVGLLGSMTPAQPPLWRPAPAQRFYAPRDRRAIPNGICLLRILAGSAAARIDGARPPLYHASQTPLRFRR